MKEHELNILATHLGHDPKTHKEYYRLSSATVELTTVSKFKFHRVLHSRLGLLEFDVVQRNI